MKITLNKILILVIAILFLILISGTTVGIINKHSQKPEVLIAKGKAINLNEPLDTEQISFFDLGTIRLITKPDSKIENNQGSAMVLTPWIAYTKGDTVFFEEISRKSGIIKSIFQKFFTEHTQNEILSIGEENFKYEILQEINEILSLGKITDIYFTDFIFL